MITPDAPLLLLSLVVPALLVGFWQSGQFGAWIVVIHENRAANVWLNRAHRPVIEIKHGPELRWVPG